MIVERESESEIQKIITPREQNTRKRSVDREKLERERKDGKRERIAELRGECVICKKTTNISQKKKSMERKYISSETGTANGRDKKKDKSRQIQIPCVCIYVCMYPLECSLFNLRLNSGV